VKYNVTEVTFKQSIPSLGSSAWMVTVKQGGYDSCELDTAEGLLTLTSTKPGLKKRRIHVSNTNDMVFGATAAAVDKK
jgi:hypothetical protein